MRLTKKNDGKGSWTQFGDKYLPAHNIKHKQCVNKLGELEDIEGELGVDLTTLFKALKNGFWVKEQNKDNDIIHVRARLNVEDQTLDFFEPNMETIGIGRNIFQYGQTWALTKEELESKEKEMIKSGLLTDKPQF